MTTFVHPSHTDTPLGPVNGATARAVTGPDTPAVPTVAARGTSGPPQASSSPGSPPALDTQLQKAVRHTGYLRRGFYLVVLLVALAGQVTGAMQTLHTPLLFALPAVAALELGGVVVLANADVRRRLGERALGSRILSAAIAAGAVTFNWLAHTNRLAGGFFAGMSALGYLVWVTHAENSRRDRLRALGDLPPTTPAYEIVGHWLRHPWLTRRARSLAKADPRLGLYPSLTAAQEQLRAERRRAAISKVLHRKIRATVDPVTADIAVHVYDLDRIADRLADRADYDGLTALIADDLTPARLAAPPAASPPRHRVRPWWRRNRTGTALPAGPAANQPGASPEDAEPQPPAWLSPTGSPAPPASATAPPRPAVPPAASLAPPEPGQPPAVPDDDLRRTQLTQSQPSPAVLPTPDRPTPPHLVLVRTDTSVRRFDAPADAAPPVGQDAGGMAPSDTRIDVPPAVPTVPGTDVASAITTGTLTPDVRPVGQFGNTNERAQGQPDDVPDDVIADQAPAADTADTADTARDVAHEIGADEDGGYQDGGDEDGGDNDSVPQETAAAVAYWYQREPGIHPRDIGARIGRSERTVRRYWPPTTDPDPDR